MAFQKRQQYLESLNKHGHCCWVNIADRTDRNVIPLTNNFCSIVIDSTYTNMKERTLQYYIFISISSFFNIYFLVLILQPKHISCQVS